MRLQEPLQLGPGIQLGLVQHGVLWRPAEELVPLLDVVRVRVDPQMDPLECAGGLRALKYGVTRDYVLGVEADGLYGSTTEAAVRAFQRSCGLVPDGITGPKTWSALRPRPG